MLHHGVSLEMYEVLARQSIWIKQFSTRSTNFLICDLKLLVCTRNFHPDAGDASKHFYRNDVLPWMSNYFPLPAV